MTTRRDFLRILGLTTAAVATPKIIFDVGANLYKFEPRGITVVQEFDMGTQMGMARMFELNGQEYRHAIRMGFTPVTIMQDGLLGIQERISVYDPSDWRPNQEQCEMATRILDDWERDKRRRILGC